MNTSPAPAPINHAQVLLQQKQRNQRQLITPEAVELTLTIASKGARMGALLLDLLILTIASVAIIYFFAVSISGYITENSDGKPTGAAEFLIILLVLSLFLLWNGYFLFFEMGPRGATVGKRIMGIRVAARDGGRLSAEAILARNLIRDIELFMPLVMVRSQLFGDAGLAGWAAFLWFLLFMFFPFFNRDSLRAGDLVAGTWVLEAPKQKLAESLSGSKAAKEGESTITGTIYKFDDEELSVYGEYELQMLEQVLRQGQQSQLESVAQTICIKIGWSSGAGDERAFLEAFYTQLRARLESNMRFGNRKADKFS